MMGEIPVGGLHWMPWKTVKVSVWHLPAEDAKENRNSHSLQYQESLHRPSVNMVVPVVSSLHLGCTCRGLHLHAGLSESAAPMLPGMMPY